MEEKDQVTIKCTLVAIRESNGYITYVFKQEFGSYIMCTQLPNWRDAIEIKIGQSGYLSYKFIRGGVDKWYDKDKDTFVPYFYSANYFINFVPETQIIDGDRIKEIDAPLMYK